ncbi:MAG: class I SAM-dependent methyltransferase [Planctomycetes bacterium]|nr:class I SAM-dependent methyltransferase [Planctomycetota bacterium]
MAEQQAAIWWKVKPYTMTSPERVVALCQSIAYLEEKKIPGAIVECGVWKGGSMMAAALALQALASTHRDLYLYDTFTGMPEPGLIDVDWQGRPARELMRGKTREGDMIRATCSLAEVKQGMMLTSYPWEKLRFVAGQVEATLPDQAPDRIALLRLDTDWYASTFHELEHLYPRLADGGVLIIDDYGHWQGAKRAVDDYFRAQGIDADLRPIDFTGRLVIKRPTMSPARAA